MTDDSNDVGFDTVTEVPEELIGTDKGVCVQFLLNNAAKVCIKRQSRNRRVYRAYHRGDTPFFSDSFTWSHGKFTPLEVFVDTKRVAWSWPVGVLKTLNDVAINAMIDANAMHVPVKKPAKSRKTGRKSSLEEILEALEEEGRRNG